MNARIETNKEEMVRGILADILEIDAADLTDEGSFSEEYDADSLRAVEILATLEKTFKVKIPEQELANMANFREVIGVLNRYGW